MSTEHKRPLLAFVLVAFACLLIIANAVRSEAVRGYLDVGAHRVVAGVHLALEQEPAPAPVVVPPSGSRFDRDSAPARTRAATPSTGTSSGAGPTSSLPSQELTVQAPRHLERPAPPQHLAGVHAAARTASHAVRAQVAGVRHTVRHTGRHAVRRPGHRTTTVVRAVTTLQPSAALHRGHGHAVGHGLPAMARTLARPAFGRGHAVAHHGKAHPGRTHHGKTHHGKTQHRPHHARGHHHHR